MAVDFKVIIEPRYIRFTCPHCGNEVVEDFEDVHFDKGSMNNGGHCYCCECDKKVELSGDYEVD